MNNFTYSFTPTHRDYLVEVHYGQKTVVSNHYLEFENALDFVNKLEAAKIHREVFHD